MNLGGCPRKKATSPLEKMIFSGKPSNILLEKVDFPGFEELCPAGKTFFSGQANLYRMLKCGDLNKKNSLTHLTREMKAVAF